MVGHLGEVVAGGVAGRQGDAEDDSGEGFLVRAGRAPDVAVGDEDGPAHAVAARVLGDAPDVRPASRAKLEEYDPWQEYERSRDEATGTNAAGKRAFEPPYLSLLNLLMAFTGQRD